MFLTVVFVLGVFGQLSSGVPLEGPTVDFRQYFDSRIVGGTEAAEGQAPHMVALIVGHSWQTFICGGSIIKKNYIMTAAHCVVIQWNGELLDTFHAIVGSNTWHKGTVVEFKSYRNHPDYNPWLIKNDVGLLETKHDIEWIHKRVAPIGLSFDYVKEGVKCYVTGWGTDSLWGNLLDKMHFLSVTTVSHKDCVAAITEATAGSGGSALPIDAVLELCAFHSINHGMCHGNSGSALVDESTGRQVGIVSWGLPCAIGAPDVFTSIFGAKQFLWSILWP